MVIAFLDESKAKGYVLVAALVKPNQTTGIRKELSIHLLGGQRSWHFRKESQKRRKQLIRIIRDCGLKVLVFRVNGQHPTIARRTLISRLIHEIQRFTITEIIFELDSSVFDDDVKILNEMRPNVAWDHRERHQEPLLWVADAVAWCVNRGGEWERMVRPLVLETIDC